MHVSASKCFCSIDKGSSKRASSVPEKPLVRWSVAHKSSGRPMGWVSCFSNLFACCRLFCFWFLLLSFGCFCCFPLGVFVAFLRLLLLLSFVCVCWFGLVAFIGFVWLCLLFFAGFVLLVFSNNVWSFYSISLGWNQQNILRACPPNNFPK